jgi:hypothetical protein
MYDAIPTARLRTTVEDVRRGVRTEPCSNANDETPNPVGGTGTPTAKTHSDQRKSTLANPALPS